MNKLLNEILPKIQTPYMEFGLKIKITDFSLSICDGEIQIITIKPHEAFYRIILDNSLTRLVLSKNLFEEINDALYDYFFIK